MAALFSNNVPSSLVQNKTPKPRRLGVRRVIPRNAPHTPPASITGLSIHHILRFSPPSMLAIVHSFLSPGRCSQSPMLPWALFLSKAWSASSAGCFCCHSLAAGATSEPRQFIQMSGAHRRPHQLRSVKNRCKSSVHQVYRIGHSPFIHTVSSIHCRETLYSNVSHRLYYCAMTARDFARYLSRKICVWAVTKSQLGITSAFQQIF